MEIKKTRKFGIKVIILGILGLLGILGYKFSRADVYLVTDVTDGDTIKVSTRGRSSFGRKSEDETINIRYIGIDTPELKKGKKKDECYALKAKQINEELVLGKEIRLEFDVNEMDNYERYIKLSPNRDYTCYLNNQ